MKPERICSRCGAEPYCPTQKQYRALLYSLWSVLTTGISDERRIRIAVKTLRRFLNATEQTPTMEELRDAVNSLDNPGLTD